MSIAIGFFVTLKKPIAFFLDCTKLTYCPTAELRINYAGKELTSKKSSETLRSNLPFGELFVEQRTNANYTTPYKFSGKEKDEETSYSYFGARYYMSDVSTWLSVDEMADQAPGWTPYRYCFQSPIMLVDPDGMSEGAPDNYVDENGAKLGTDKDGDNGVTRIISNKEWVTITSRNGAKTDKGTNELRKVSSKNPILFKNENAAYNYIWGNSFGSDGKFKVENAAWLTDNGVVALPIGANDDETTTHLTGAKKIGDFSKYTYNFAGKTLRIRGSIHTHEPGSVLTDIWDIDASKFGPSFSIHSDVIYMNYYHGGYDNPKTLVGVSLMQTKTLLTNPRYSLIKYSIKNYWNAYYKK